jgi:hypothetical protein
MRCILPASARRLPRDAEGMGDLLRTASVKSRKQRSIGRAAIIVLAAIALSTPVATGALAAGRGGESGTGAVGEGEFRGGYVPLQESVPQTPPPVFNPSSPYNLPESPEVPVSPASPGSVFGNN